MSLINVALVSRALLRIGANPIASFDDDSAEAEISGALFDTTRDALLSSYPWSFATAQCRLPLLDEQPVADFNYAFQLPNDFLRAISVGKAGKGRGVPFRVTRDQIHSNDHALVLTYIFRPEEATFPPFFEELLIKKLSAEFCLPLTESTSRAEMLYRLAEQEYRAAKRIDAQQDTPNRFDDFTLVNNR